jgi:hypothetical protein
MPRAYSATAAAANSGGAETCTIWQKTCIVSPLQAAITDIIKSKKPAGTKAWAFLCDLFGIKERSAKSRLSNSVSYSIEELQALIQGEDGLQYFEALMADAEPAWWAWARWAIEQGALKRLAVEATQKSLQLEQHLPVSPARRKGNADVKKLSAELSRSQTALGLLDSFSHRAGGGAVVPAQAKAASAGRAAGGRGR